MHQFIGLRAKMYACKVDGIQTIKITKGVKRYVISNKLTFEDYINCLNNKCDKICDQNITSNKHTLYSSTVSKIALSPFDNKRHICED